MKILGVDPGYDRIGWCIATSEKRGELQLHSFSCLETDRSKSLSQRYSAIAQFFYDLILHHKPDHLAIEKLFFSKNTTTALQVAEARGVILCSAALNRMTLSEYAPNTVKEAVTGNGAATKKEVAKMIQLQLGITTKGLKDDTIDAVAIALTDSLYRSQPS